MRGSYSHGGEWKRAPGRLRELRVARRWSQHTRREGREGVLYGGWRLDGTEKTGDKINRRSFKRASRSRYFDMFGPPRTEKRKGKFWRVRGTLLLLPRPPPMTKYILVSGGVVSGIGKGVIGAQHDYPSFHPQYKCSSPPSSLLHGLAPQDHRLESHRHQNRPIHEYRCWHHEAAGAW